MSLTVKSLASGSSGNAFLVRVDDEALLVDAGVSVRTVERQLRSWGLEPSSLRGIVVTHEHHDHVCGVGPLARKYRIPIICSAGTADVMRHAWKALDIRPLSLSGTTIGAADVRGFPVPHDAAEPMGVVVRGGGLTAAWAVDLGQVQDEVAYSLREADLVVVEANHDRERLVTSHYRWPIKIRILSDTGHLSNQQAAELLKKVAEDGRPRTAWLAHLSANTNDHPRNVLKLMQNYLDMAGANYIQLQIAERDHPSVEWGNHPSTKQASLFDGF